MQRGRFSLGTERDSILTTPAYASERKIHVPWRHGPLTALSASVKQATIRLMPKSVGIEHKAQDDTSLLVSLSLCVSALRNCTTPLVCRAGFRFRIGIPGQVASRGPCGFVSQARSPGIAGTNIEVPPWCAPWNHLPALVQGDAWTQEEADTQRCLEVECYPEALDQEGQ